MSRQIRWLPALFAAVGCGPRHSVEEVADIYAYTDSSTVTDRDPIVVIPGFFGSHLEQRGTGVSVWGHFLKKQPKPTDPDFARLMALPVADAPLETLVDDVVPTGALRLAEVELGRQTIEINAYPGVLTGILLGPDHAKRATKKRLTQAARSVEDDDIPALADVAYDWRRDIVEAAKLLDEQLDRSIEVAKSRRRQAGLSTDDVRLDAIGHSTGGLVLLYYMRYGTDPLPDDGSVPPPTWAGSEKIRRAILIGVPTLGTLESFEAVAFGGRAQPLLPNIPAPVAGTFVSLYELMPSPRLTAVVYEDGTPADLYDANVWRRNGWGLFSPKQAELLAALIPEAKDTRARHEIAHKYLERVLGRAAQFHRAMEVTTPQAPQQTTFHLFASDAEPTTDVVVIRKETGDIVRRVLAAGDGTVVRASALADLRPDLSQLDPLQSSVRWTSVHWVDGGHVSMIGGPDLVDNLLFLLFAAEVPDPRRCQDTPRPAPTEPLPDVPPPAEEPVAPATDAAGSALGDGARDESSGARSSRETRPAPTAAKPP